MTDPNSSKNKNDKESKAVTFETHYCEKRKREFFYNPVTNTVQWHAPSVALPMEKDGARVLVLEEETEDEESRHEESHDVSFSSSSKPWRMWAVGLVIVAFLGLQYWALCGASSDSVSTKITIVETTPEPALENEEVEKVEGEETITENEVIDTADSTIESETGEEESETGEEESETREEESQAGEEESRAGEEESQAGEEESETGDEIPAETATKTEMIEEEIVVEAVDQAETQNEPAEESVPAQEIEVEPKEDEPKQEEITVEEVDQAETQNEPAEESVPREEIEEERKEDEPILEEVPAEEQPAEEAKECQGDCAIPDLSELASTHDTTERTHSILERIESELEAQNKEGKHNLCKLPFANRIIPQCKQHKSNEPEQEVVLDE